MDTNAPGCTVLQGLLPSGPLLGSMAPLLDAAIASTAASHGLPLLATTLLFCGALAVMYGALHCWHGRRLQHRLQRQQAEIDRYRREQLRLQLHSAHDSLTGAFTRATVLEMLAIEAERSKRFGRSYSALLVTVDHYSTLQHHYGVDAAHAVLVDLVRQCRTHVRPFDIIGRYGADEFLILLAEADPATARRIAHRLHADVAQTPLQWDGQAIGYTVSIAHHSLAPQQVCPVTLLERCQQALRQARNSGTSQVAGV